MLELVKQAATITEGKSFAGHGKKRGYVTNQPRARNISLIHHAIEPRSQYEKTASSAVVFAPIQAASARR